MPLVEGKGYKLDELVSKSPWEFRKKGARNDDSNITIWYEGEAQAFTDEEIAVANAKFLAENEAAMAAIIADGFIKFPLFHRDLDGELTEFVAWLHPDFEPSCTEGFFERHGMSTNIYVPSYERAGIAPTMKMLDSFHVENYYICVDPSQYLKYKEHYPARQLVIRDINFRRADVQEPLSGLKRPMHMAGHAPLCNFTLALSRSLGEEYFSFSDDDFFGLAMKAHIPDRLFDHRTEKYDKNNFYRCSNIREEYGFNFQEFWHRLELLSMKTRNPGFIGLEKFGTVFNLPVSFKFGTRVYSFYITKNDTQMEHIGWQNNDVITSMEHSKHGQVNVLLEAISYNSAPTQGKGGQAQLYTAFGTLDKGKQLVRSQPNYTAIIERYSRIHHTGDFTGYNKQRMVGEVIRPEDGPSTTS